MSAQPRSSARISTMFFGESANAVGATKRNRSRLRNVFMFFDFRLVDRINTLTLVAVDGELCGVCRRLLWNYCGLYALQFLNV